MQYFMECNSMILKFCLFEESLAYDLQCRTAWSAAGSNLRLVTIVWISNSFDYYCVTLFKTRIPMFDYRKHLSCCATSMKRHNFPKFPGLNANPSVSEKRWRSDVVGRRIKLVAFIFYDKCTYILFIFPSRNDFDKTRGLKIIPTK